MVWEKGHTEERSPLIGNNVGSSAIKPAATIGIMAVKILQETEKDDTKENRGKKTNTSEAL